MLLQLLFYYGVLQTVHNLLRFLQIDSEVFRCGTPGEPFSRAQCNRGLFTIFSDALHYDVPAHASSWLASGTSESIPVLLPTLPGRREWIQPEYSEVKMVSRWCITLLHLPFIWP